MAAFISAGKNKKPKAQTPVERLEFIRPVLPPEKEWEFNVQLGTLMLNGQVSTICMANTAPLSDLQMHAVYGRLDESSGPRR